MENLSTQEIKALLEISHLYKNPLELSIKQILLKDNILNITLGRPGLLVGYHGESINKLTEALKIKLDNPELSIKIWESSIDNYLISDVSILENVDLI